MAEDPRCRPTPTTPTTSATPTIENPFRYAGQYTDDTTGLQYLRARYYDPATGQFLSRDPLEDSTLQPYAYADNDPTNATDPTGLSVGGFLSNASVGIFHAATMGYSTKLAAALLHYDVDCAHFGAGFGTGELIGTVGSFFTGEGEAALAAKAGKEGVLAAKAGEEVASAGRVAKAIDDSGSPTAPFGRPGPDFEWRGPKDKGSWYNPRTGEYWRPDPHHGPPQGPHWDYRDPNGDRWRVYPDGRVEPKKSR